MHRNTFAAGTLPRITLRRITAFSKLFIAGLMGAAKRFREVTGHRRRGLKPLDEQEAAICWQTAANLQISDKGNYRYSKFWYCPSICPKNVRFQSKFRPYSNSQKLRKKRSMDKFCPPPILSPCYDATAMGLHINCRPTCCKVYTFFRRQRVLLFRLGLLQLVFVETFHFRHICTAHRGNLTLDDTRSADYLAVALALALKV